ncbi:hypothetical protein HYH02_004942 [Chlamydomonas schloesseri]|uniref:Uncharacterized protein n=1 Tax=Chlamydomonas schloesseri TaxID=2026947 RepID=A0A836B8B4_9CHLO|nr:hypothetical protein HYH02_004942 [Chlamydomonas schloesseri]|eukprot:KAG2450440.1 hypothetical protein HYH02_004942 [Chlamydomonas schloesseri]
MIVTGAPSTATYFGSARSRGVRACFRVVAHSSARGSVGNAEAKARNDSGLDATTGNLPRRSVLAFTGAILASSWSSLPARAEDSVVNDPAALKAKLEQQYKLWGEKKFDAWLATQSGSFKWQSTYAGVPLKLKGKEGASQYFAALNADLDIKSYQALAIFVDNDGDEATVVVEASGASRRTKAAFKTVFLHSYTIGPNFQLLKFKEQTDTQLLAALVPAAAAAAGAGPAGLEGDSVPVPPGPAARTA